MTARVFVDTNVLIYQFDKREPDKKARAAAWMDYLWATRTGLVSFQVLQEFYAIATRKLAPGMAPEKARKIVQTLFQWNPSRIDDRVFFIAWVIQDQFGLSWWDALIAASARLAGCSHLLTEDLQHGQNLDGVRVVNPFQVLPGEQASIG